MFNFFKKEKKEDPKNLDELLFQFKDLKLGLSKVFQEIETIKRKNKFMVQKTGFVRYNPFKGVGGNQSFSIALLDENNTGVVISSLYSREGNRVYGKLINNGESGYQLSKEEKEAINKAIKPEV